MWGSLLFLVLYGITTVFGEACSTEGGVRLDAFKQSDLHAGFVEVCHNGEWGTVCTDSFFTPWSEKNAQVVCRQLGYSGALNSVLQDTLPLMYRISENSSVPVHYKSVHCDGTETTLNECTLSENSGECQHLLDAAIVCRKNAKYGDVRLVGSTSNGEGIVEINDVALGWVRVCPDTWTDTEAGVVCRQMGYDSGVSNVYSRSNIEPLSQVALAFSCTSTDDLIEDCYSFSPSVFMCSASSSTHAGAVCTSSSAPEGAVRLTGGSSGDNGRVEVLYNGKWGTVCSYRGWRVSDGRVVCHELGYNPNDEGISTSKMFSRRSNVKPIWLAGVVCNVGDTTISDCTNDPPIGYGERCDHTTNDAKLDCDVDPIELSEGAITGIVVGSIGFVCLMCCCVWCSYLFKDDCKKKYPTCYKIATCWNCCKSCRHKRRSSNATAVTSCRNRRSVNTTGGRQSLNPTNTTRPITAATTTTRVTRGRVGPSSSSSSSVRPTPSKPKPQPSDFQVAKEAPPSYSAATGLLVEVLAAVPRQDSQHGDSTDLPPPYANPSGTDNNLPETTV